MNFTRLPRSIAFVSFLFGASSAAFAQDYPTKPIRMIVAAAPGGSPDLIARAMSPGMATLLGQPITIDNIPGAGGVVGVRTLIKSNPDGYTLIFTDTGKWGIAPALQPDLYDPMKELAPISLAAANVTGFVVSESFPAKNLQEFIAAVKAKPGFYHYGSSGNGSVHHLSMETFKAVHGLNITHVPFKGASQSSQALLGGQIPIIVAGPSTIKAQLKAGQVRMLAVISKQRSKYFPDVPSIAEFGGAGGADMDFRGDLGYLAPAGTPKPVIDKLAGVVHKVLQQPEVLARVDAIGSEPLTSTPEEFAAIVKADLARFRQAVKISGAKVD